MALTPDGTTKCLVGADWSQFEGLRAFSAAWACKALDGNTIGTILAKWNLFVDYTLFIGYDTIGANQNWSLSATNSTPTSCQYTVTDATTADGAWHYFAATYNGANGAGARWKLWRDGSALTLTATQDNDVTTANSGKAVTIGCAYTGNSLDAGYGWKGSIAEVRFWNSELGADEALLQSTPPVKSVLRYGTLPMAWWPLGGRTGNQARDLFNTYNMTATNSPTWGDHCQVIYPAGPTWRRKTYVPRAPSPVAIFENYYARRRRG